MAVIVSDLLLASVVLRLWAVRPGVSLITVVSNVVCSRKNCSEPRYVPTHVNDILLARDVK